MAIIKIGVLSDTHIPTRARYLPAEIFTGLQGVDMILHAGDLTSLAVLGDLAALAPVYAVCGNVDPVPVRLQLPYRRIVDAGSRRIGLVHGHGAGYSTPERALRAFSGDNIDAVVFGHSHQPLCERRRGCLLFNPGSATDRRFCPRFSYGILTVSPNDISGEIVYFGP